MEFHKMASQVLLYSTECNFVWSKSVT